MSDAPQGVRRMLDIDELVAIIPISRTTIWRMERDGRFPASHLASHRTCYQQVLGWLLEVDRREPPAGADPPVAPQDRSRLPDLLGAQRVERMCRCACHDCPSITAGKPHPDG